jgi:hypothetical protein
MLSNRENNDERPDFYTMVVFKLIEERTHLSEIAKSIPVLKPRTTDPHSSGPEFERS